MNIAMATSSNIYYTIVANQLQLSNVEGGLILELIYYSKLVPLTATYFSNWLSVDNPDTYVFGLMVEISSFVKNPEAKMLWDQRFIDSLGEITSDDSVSRWSGTALRTRLG